MSPFTPASKTMKPTFAGNKRFLFGFLLIAAYGFKHRGFWSLVHWTLNDVEGTLACFLHPSKFSHDLCRNFRQAQVSSCLCLAVSIFKSSPTPFYCCIIDFHVFAALESLSAKFCF